MFDFDSEYSGSIPLPPANLNEYKKRAHKNSKKFNQGNFDN